MPTTLEAAEAELQEIEARLQPALDAIANDEQEAARLRAVIDILKGDTIVPTSRRSGGSGRASQGTSDRAPRGSVTDAILKTVEERPGVSAAEVSNVIGGKKQTVTSALQKLAADGRLEKVKLDGARRVGYKLPA